MNPILITIIQAVTVLALAPLAMGLTSKFKAFLQGRQGASIFLPYVTLATLLKKEMVISRSTSWVFRLVPFAVLTATIFIAMALPLISRDGLLAPFSHFVIIAGLLALGAVFLVLGGLESASAFGGMGSEREMTITALVEPVIITVFAGLTFAAGTPLINDMLVIGGAKIFENPFAIFSLAALILAALAENARYPVDNPATHLELTMVHEAMVLEYSGPYLALLEYASSLKLTVFALLIANFIYPGGLLTAGATFSMFGLVLIITVSKLVVATAMVAVLESVIAKMRFYRMSEYFTGAFLLALAGLVLMLISSAF